MIAAGLGSASRALPGARLRVGTRWLGLAALAWCAGGLVTLAGAQGATDRSVGPPQRSVAEWLVRLQQASRLPSYVGTFVVSSASGALSSARIWHVCEGEVQMERVEALTGAPRSTFRRNEAVMTFLPEARVVKVDQRDSGGMFPNLLNAGQGFATADYYTASEAGQGRVAGFDADIVLLQPRDDWRFGYRIWSEKRSGLVVKSQTVDAQGRVLEQAAFSELQLDAPVRADKLRQLMDNTEGYRVMKAERVRTTPESEGWRLKSGVPGFLPQSCYRRPVSPVSSVVQWVFSDGLATVSLFMQPFDRERHDREGLSGMGATHTMTRRLSERGGDWWITAVGEVPPGTLKAFVHGLERRP
ncbi:MucB/RseB C-terminal domain-containing protein [Ottowia sp.]|uniref:MucB/RseB C-terminal domain-containing protein n=1 Tax=Ottowia sp. TaxID=1898956 RepID=UPI002B98B4CE|nr:MucB/RseB C-terminal domain-containing protein [Ottowia sp.]HOB65733.1 MucB/RseB C-terminal domain-containing protein [Ottowia sp.]HPZ58526.1 MucB/RseB C-terminal domain-containing protein [Ottowia sp.]HQD47346.1 MucB/RseB C-terminal domain-containing protein [Ottowia sp.]